MLERIIIIGLGFCLVVIGAICMHWIFNIREWTTEYINNTKKNKDEKKSKLKFRDKAIVFLAKGKPQSTPIFVYIIMTSLVLLSLMGLIYLARWWYSV